MDERFDETAQKLSQAQDKERMLRYQAARMAARLLEDYSKKCSEKSLSFQIWLGPDNTGRESWYQAVMGDGVLDFFLDGTIRYAIKDQGELRQQVVLRPPDGGRHWDLPLSSLQTELDKIGVDGFEEAFLRVRERRCASHDKRASHVLGKIVAFGIDRFNQACLQAVQKAVRSSESQIDDLEKQMRTLQQQLSGEE